MVNQKNLEAKPRSRGPRNQCFHRSVAMATGRGAQPTRVAASQRSCVRVNITLSRLSPVPVINKCSENPRNKSCCVFASVLLMFGWVVSLWLVWPPHKLSHGLNVWEFLSPLNPWNVLNSWVQSCAIIVLTKTFVHGAVNLRNQIILPINVPHRQRGQSCRNQCHVQRVCGADASIHGWISGWLILAFYCLMDSTKRYAHKFVFILYSLLNIVWKQKIARRFVRI